MNTVTQSHSTNNIDVDLTSVTNVSSITDIDIDCLTTATGSFQNLIQPNEDCLITFYNNYTTDTILTIDCKSGEVIFHKEDTESLSVAHMLLTNLIKSAHYHSQFDTTISEITRIQLDVLDKVSDLLYNNGSITILDIKTLRNSYSVYNILKD